MEITEIKVFPVQEEKLKAFVSVVFDRCFMVNDIKIIQGRQGMFISMPSRKKKNGEFKDVAHPLNNDTRQMIEAQVLTEYDRVLEERAAGGEPQPRRAPKRRSASGTSRRAAATEAEAGAEESSETPETTETRERRRSARTRPGSEASGSEPPAGAASEAGLAEASGPDAGQADTSQAGAQDTAATSEEMSEETSEEESAEKTLEEIEEMHLRDSFWSVP
jgi:stage V sporulation protein G